MKKLILIAFITWLWTFFTPVHPKEVACIVQPQWQSIAERVAARIVN